MGIYIYSVRTKNVKVEIEGETVAVHALQYLDRLERFGDAKNERLIGNAKRTWANREDKPRFVFMADDGKPVDGAEVFEWDGRAVTYDDDFEGRVRSVGFLRKVGRQWTLAPIYFEIDFGRMRPSSFGPGECYHIRKTKSAFSADEAKAIAFAECDAGEKVTIRHFEATPDPELDRLVRENACFKGFQDLLDAKGGYRPSLDCRDPIKVQIADAYDAAMTLRGDDRRAYRYGA